IVGLTNVLATFIAIGLVDRWGRKPTLTLGFLVMAIGMGILGTTPNQLKILAFDDYFGYRALIDEVNVWVLPDISEEPACGLMLE
ncbi:MFS transporter, partial [Salmonella enterica subsp. enterica serovar Anatum]|nr:MFS transporter [Salmonella enterica subsp. enterica serovar Anatum]